MKTKIIPFDLETAKKIQVGEIKGKIKTRDLKTTMNIVCYNSAAMYYDTLQPIIAQNIEDCTDLCAYDKNGAYVGEEHPKDLVLEVPDNEPQFKPFDKVLVRIGKNCIWQPSIFSCQIRDCFYTVSGYPYEKENIIPYEGNEHLVGTTDKPKEE